MEYNTVRIPTFLWKIANSIYHAISLVLHTPWISLLQQYSSVFNTLQVYFRILLQQGQMLHVQIFGGGGGGASISYIYTTKVTVIVTYVICIHYYIIIHVLEQTKFLGGTDQYLEGGRGGRQKPTLPPPPPPPKYTLSFLM